MVRSGQSAYMQWNLETSFNGGATTYNKAFGMDQKCSISTNESAMLLPALNKVEYDKVVYLETKKDISARWVLSSPWFFELLLGSLSSNLSDPTIHTFTPAKIPESAGVEIGFDSDTSNVVRKFAGVVMKSATISAQLGGTAEVSAELMASTEAVSSSLDSTSASDDIDFPYSFVHGTITVGTTVVAQVQSIDLTIDSKAELLYGFGSSTAVAAYNKIFSYSGKINGAMLSNVGVNQVLDRENVSAFSLLFSNGLTGANKKSIVFTGSGMVPKSHSVSFDPGEPVFEDREFDILGLVVTAENDTVSPP